ncbi:ATP-binding protein [Streptomyces sp. NBC_01260]|uniref:ATP-binding protein n=1 Tax=unclassified Streptomyces TaxID=2593676 RepID=UPI002E308CD2|nr:ATP-binding protein [Streptomyces sp. NBC_01260]
MIAVLTAVVLPLLLAEFGDWCPWLAKRLVRWTARHLGDAAVVERYSEEWLAEIEEVPGKLSCLVVAIGKVSALPKSRWELRAQRRAVDRLVRLGDLLPTGRPSYWDHLGDSGVIYRFVHQAEACSRMVQAVADDDPRCRNDLHVLVGPAGSGKTVVLQWIYEALHQQGKEVHYLYAPRWVTSRSQSSLPLDRRSRKRLARASEDVGLLMVDEADGVTIQAVQSLRLRCPVLIVGRASDLSRRPRSTGVEFDLTPQGGGFLRHGLS